MCPTFRLPPKSSSVSSLRESFPKRGILYFRETIKMYLLLLAFFLPLISGYEITATGGGIGKTVSKLLIFSEQKTFFSKTIFFSWSQRRLRFGIIVKSWTSLGSLSMVSLWASCRLSILFIRFGRGQGNGRSMNHIILVAILISRNFCL